ncbi:hypothetical protein [Flavobacterium petrolei]|uniref:hypothetical protein n=1 Tax=Flavobacterium petrolei TaxID=2259594 RepID=UPI003757145B
MSYESTVYRILIASPSDVEEEREMASRIIQDWNDLNSFNKKIVLLPVKWETHSSPTYGVRPQEAINKQIVDDCDLLLGFFWTKLGTPTGEDVSGTIEEIKRVSKAGKPVMLYFSKRGKDPSQIDIKQLESLSKFKEDVYKIALVENYNSIVDFRDKVSRQIEMKIRELQERKIPSKDLISFSFIDTLTGKLSKDRLELNVERIVLEEKQLEKILKSDKRVAKKKWSFNEQLVSFINKKNNIPVILGLENNTNRTLSNVLAELKIISSIEESLVIHSTGSNDENDLFHNLGQLDISKENQTNILKLFKNNITQTSSKVWEFNTKPLSLLPNKAKIIDTVIILYPKETLTIDFHINLFSENVLQPIENTCSLAIKVTKREITEEEISDIIAKTSDDDDLPF